MTVKRIWTSIFNVCMILICGCFLFAGCGEKSTETISILQAKEIIVNALALDDMTNALEDETFSTNRDVFTKFHNTDVYVESKMSAGEMSSNTQYMALIEKTNGVWTKYTLSNSLNDVSGSETFTTSTLEYYDGEYVYTDRDGEKSKSLFADNMSESQNLSMILVSFDYVFLDDAFDIIYQNDVTKTSRPNSYTLTIDLNIFEYANFVMDKCPNADGMFGSGETLEKLKTDGFGEMIMTFDSNNQLISINFQMQTFGQTGDLIVPCDATIILTKSNDTVSAPAWFDEADFATL